MALLHLQEEGILACENVKSSLWSLLPNFQKGVAWKVLNCYMKVARKEGGDIFQGEGVQFLHKNKLKSEKLMTKKVYKQKCFSLS